MPIIHLIATGYGPIRLTAVAADARTLIAVMTEDTIVRAPQLPTNQPKDRPCATN